MTTGRINQVANGIMRFRVPGSGARSRLLSVIGGWVVAVVVWCGGGRTDGPAYSEPGRAAHNTARTDEPAHGGPGRATLRVTLHSTSHSPTYMRTVQSQHTQSLACSPRRARRVQQQRLRVARLVAQLVRGCTPWHHRLPPHPPRMRRILATVSTATALMRVALLGLGPHGDTVCVRRGQMPCAPHCVSLRCKLPSQACLRVDSRLRVPLPAPHAQSPPVCRTDIRSVLLRPSRPMAPLTLHRGAHVVRAAGLGRWEPPHNRTIPSADADKVAVCRARLGWRRTARWT